MSHQALLWICFHIFVFSALLIDLGVFQAQPRNLDFKESLKWSGIWIICALLFNLGILHFEGRDTAVEFLTAYVVEWSLSIDNLFVFLTLFATFKVPKKHQPKVLFWGVLGAFVLRAAFIIVGLSLLKQFHWLIYGFGAFLIYAGIQLVIENTGEESEKAQDDEFKNYWLLKFLKKHFRFTDDYREGNFFVKAKVTDKTTDQTKDSSREVWFATPLFIVLLLVEATDLVFATDSIPAVMAVTQNNFVAYSSNVLAVLGLRSMYFAVAQLLSFFRYLHFGLAGVLCFIGVKMCISGYYEISTPMSLLVILTLLTFAIVFSVLHKEDSKNKKDIHK